MRDARGTHSTSQLLKQAEAAPLHCPYCDPTALPVCSRLAHCHAPQDLGFRVMGIPPVLVHLWGATTFVGTAIVQEASCAPLGYVGSDYAATYLNVSATVITDPAFWQLPPYCGA